jgi:hypothetical protein
MVVANVKIRRFAGFVVLAGLPLGISQNLQLKYVFFRMQPAVLILFRLSAIGCPVRSVVGSILLEELRVLEIL